MSLMLSHAKLAKKIIDSNYGRLKRPYKLIYVATKECHSRCVNCKIWTVRPRNELTLDEVTKLARQSPFLNWLNITGGEPTDRPDLPEVVGAFLKHCPDLVLLNFPTNGLNTDRIVSSCERILSLKPRKFVVAVSIDGPTEVNDKLRGISGDFKSAVETLLRLKKLKGLQTIVGMTLYETNLTLIEETIAEIQSAVPSFKHHDLHLNIPSISSHFYGNELVAPKPSLALATEIAALKKRRGLPKTPMQFLERIYQNQIESYVSSGVTPIDCAAMTASVYLSEKGDVYPCTIWNRPLGNIRDTDYSLEPFIESDAAVKVREEIRKKQCPNCWSPCEAVQSIAARIL